MEQYGRKKRFHDSTTQSILFYLIPLSLSWPHIFSAKEWEVFLFLHEENVHFIRENPSFSEQYLCRLIQEPSLR